MLCKPPPQPSCNTSLLPPRVIPEPVRANLNPTASRLAWYQLALRRSSRAKFVRARRRVTFQHSTLAFRQGGGFYRTFGSSIGGAASAAPRKTTHKARTIVFLSRWFISLIVYISANEKQLLTSPKEYTKSQNGFILILKINSPSIQQKIIVLTFMTSK